MIWLAWLDAEDKDFPQIIKGLKSDVSHDSFSLNEGFFTHNVWLCITKELHEKVMFESHVPSYTRHRGIQTKVCT